MNQNILECIKQLTSQDSKTLSQKLAKTGEEFGELCKVTLPYEHAAGTIHRFVEQQQILEECVDVTLSVLSIAYSLGYDDVDLQQMMLKKINKWGDLQGKELTVDDNIPYELHVTVEIEEDRIPSFKNVCDQLGIKPIVIDLHGHQRSTRDVMTSSVFHGTNSTVMGEMERIVDGLSEFTILRRKIETVPWHPAAPQKYGDVMPVGGYFESHLAVEIHKDFYPKLKECASQYNAHTSSNAFKNVDHDTQVIMVTLRDYSSPREFFNQYLEMLKAALTQLGNRLQKNYPEKRFSLDKEIVEYSIYDDKVSHDQHWIES